MAHVFFGDQVFANESVSIEQRPAEFRTPLYVVLATPLTITLTIVVTITIAVFVFT